MTQRASCVVVAGLALLGCRAPQDAASPHGSSVTTDLRQGTAAPTGDTAHASGLAVPLAAISPDSIFKVLVSFEGIAAKVTLESPMGASVSDSSTVEDTLPPAHPAVDGACDCSGPQMWAENVQSGDGTLTIEARSSGSLWIQLIIYTRKAERSKSWTLDSLPLRSGDTKRFHVHFPGVEPADSLRIEPLR